jgi:type III secretion protein V
MMALRSMSDDAPRAGPFALLARGDLRALLSRHADVALAAFVVLIVAMMIVPLPTFALDILISFNIAVSVTLLLVAIYVSEPLKIATFPTLLLLTTLFRLALEVSATRLILTNANAGEVIRAFGNFVVSGNLVVGAVIFVILTLVQFVVVSKGSERVAEVGARFALDAMPGKQMSIDAELRSGHIDHAEARRRRSVLARESQFFGSMDGAMKFVKGDAIAGMVVLLTNIVGGLVIGVWQRHMDLASAARTFTVLTIGEGLVAQIPALVISTGAGILVTRVSSEEEGGHLGRDVGAQILAYPKALALAAGLMGLLALVPGLPTAPFLVLGAGVGFVAFRLMRAPAPAPPQAAPGRVEIRSPLLTPITIELGPGLADAPDGPLIRDQLPALRERLFQETGIPLPAVRVRHAGSLPAGGYALRLNEVEMARGLVVPENGVATRPPEEVIASHLLELLRRYGHELLGIQETQGLVDALERTHPALVREVVPKLISPTLLTDVLRRLAEEGISLRSLRQVLGALAEWAPLERDPVALTEHVRAALRRQITAQHVGPRGTLGVYLLDPMIEEAVREAIRKTPTGTYLALEPELARDIVRAAGKAFTSAAGESPPVVITGADIRRFVRRLLEVDHPGVAVLSHQELTPEAKLQPLGRVRVSQ